MKHFILAITILASTLFAGGAVLAPAYVAADAKSEICKGIGATTGGGCRNDGTLTRVVRVVINLFSVIIGIVAVIMIMVAGFKYVTANGDSGSLSSAKNTLVYAIVGLVIVALAQFIVKFVLDKIL